MWLEWDNEDGVEVGVELLEVIWEEIQPLPEVVCS